MRERVGATKRNTEYFHLDVHIITERTTYISAKPTAVDQCQISSSSARMFSDPSSAFHFQPVQSEQDLMTTEINMRLVLMTQRRSSLFCVIVYSEREAL